MKEYVLVCQGMEIVRSTEPLPMIRNAIKNNEYWREYVQRCRNEHEDYADNELFVFVEDGDDVKQIELSLCDYSFHKKRIRSSEEFELLLDAVTDRRGASYFHDAIEKDIPDAFKKIDAFRHKNRSADVSR